LPQVVFHSPSPAGPAWLRCEDLVDVIQASSLPQVLPCLGAVERAVERDGLTAAGFIAYEAAPGIDPCLQTHAASALPLAWFGLFRRMSRQAAEECRSPDERFCQWQPSISRADYADTLSRIRRYIAAGDTYQVNFTYRLKSRFDGVPWELFRRLCREQPSPCCAFVETDDFALCSASPELFWRLDGDELLSRPMKGTAPRGLWPDDDRRRKAALKTSAKDLAENAMIVDMVRNDMGRIARQGSVEVRSRFDVETYPTAFQMTSTVACRTAAPFTEIVKALFPCASITGAPKVRTMQIIKELETSPRGAYCGCIGYLAPGPKAHFNVAIRTVEIDKRAAAATYGVGGGIVWDSLTQSEYDECRTKAAILLGDAHDFDLLESILHDRRGYLLLEEHLDRLAGSAEYFGVALDMSVVRARLAELAAKLLPDPRKVRLLAGRRGDVRLEAVEVTPMPPTLRLRWAAEPVDGSNVFLYHKTTSRSVYDRAKAAAGDCDDVLLWNERGEITETTFANIVVRLDGRLCTPPVECGLLGGVFRAHLLAGGNIREKIVTIDDMTRAEEIFAINSVRGWMPATLEGAPPKITPCRLAK